MGKGKFLLGLGVGAVLGGLCYHFSRTEKAKEWKEKACHAAKNVSRRMNERMDSGKEKISAATE